MTVATPDVGESADLPSRSFPPGRQLWVVDVEAPPQRLAAFRILSGSFAVAYLLIRLPAFVELSSRSAGFEGSGLAWFLAGPVAPWVVVATIAVTIAAGVGYTTGAAFRLTGPVFAFGVLALTSYRGSWGQLLHFENLVTIHLLIVSLSPAADRWSFDDRRRRRRGVVRPERSPTAYGWPLALASLVVVLTYVIAGVAKLRYGGVEWIFGDTLRNHVAYSAARLDLLGGTPSPVAGWVVGLDVAWPVVAGASVLIELAAPIALLGGRWRTGWVVAVWLMHAGILVFMLVGFPYPLFLVAFAPFYRLERLGRLVGVRRVSAPGAVADVSGRP